MTFEAAVAAFGDVSFCGALVCDSALPAAVLDLGAVAELVSVFDALDAAFGLVSFDLAMMISFLLLIVLLPLTRLILTFPRNLSP
jgi:hypothetical protein